ncbi:MAG: phosphoglucosamine mutase [Methanobacteriota archaeon]|nr:MAG: phosphoglucosamine mutase [Euryarchaeota archaeon]
MRIFGSSGVRGIVNKEMTPELALKIGMAVGSKAEGAVIGFDSRTSNSMMGSAVSSGLMACGCDVYEAGFVTTPTLAEAARELDCGVMLTASHNPPEYAGVKLWNPDGSGFGADQSRAVEGAIETEEYSLKPWNLVGSTHHFPDAVERHAERIIADAGTAELKVIVDCANGPALTITPMVLQQMGCRVVTLNSNADGRFPGRSPEPIEENLTDLMRAVVSMDADLGIAHDGDADRMVAVDDEGKLLAGDELLALFAKRYASKRIVVTVDTSTSVDDYVGTEVIRTRVGDVFVSEEVKRTEADFGGEPSGTWIFPEQTFCPDGVLAATRIVEIASEQRLSAARKDVPRYATMRTAVSYRPEDRDVVLDRLDAEMTAVESDEVLTLDGYRLKFEDGWALVRPSGTEPKIRVVAEARTTERTEQLMTEMSDRVRRCVG